MLNRYIPKHNSAIKKDRLVVIISMNTSGYSTVLKKMLHSVSLVDYLVELVEMKILGPKMDSTTGKKQVKYFIVLIYYCIGH